MIFMIGHHLGWVGTLVTGFLLGFVASHLYRKKRMKREIREKYVLLSAAQGRIESLERTLRYQPDEQTMMQASPKKELPTAGTQLVRKRRMA